MTPSEVDHYHSRPKSYKAAVVSKIDGPLNIEEKELIPPKDGQILIKVLANGLCHSDAFTVKGLLGAPLPRTPGHEIGKPLLPLNGCAIAATVGFASVGRVVAVPKSESRWKLNDLVASGWLGGYCGECKQCQLKHYFQCKLHLSNGGTEDGGYAEYCYLRTEAAAAVPKDADPLQIAALGCAGVTVYNGMRRVQGLPETPLVGIQGIGGLGHLAIQFAKAMGFTVAALSASENKRDLALELGATHFITGSAEEQAKKLQELGGANLIVLTAPDAPSYNSLLWGLAPHGVLLGLGLPWEPLQFNAVRLLEWNLTIMGHSAGSAYDLEDTINFAVKHNVRTMCETYKLQDAQKAYDDMYANKPRLRAIFDMS